MEEHLSYKYVSICTKCKKEHLIYTQSNEPPVEYHTDVGVQCDCGEIV